MEKIIVYFGIQTTDSWLQLAIDPLESGRSSESSPQEMFDDQINKNLLQFLSILGQKILTLKNWLWITLWIFKDDNINTPVLFTAIGDSGTVEGDTGILYFNKIWTNIGNGFNGNSFTAPKSGYYEFTFSCKHTHKGHNSVGVRKNNHLELAIMGDYNHGGYAGGHDINYGTTFQMALNEHDIVQLYVKQGKISSDSDANRIFTGKFLRTL